MFSFHVKRAIKIKLFHVKHRLFLRFSPLYIPLLSRFYLFYINIIVLGYVDFSRYLFVVFMGILVLNQVLFYGVLQRVLLLCLSVSRLVWQKTELVLSVFLPPCHRVFRSQIGVFVWAWSISTWQQRKYVGWLAGWLVRLRSFRLFRLGQIVACRSPIIAPVFDKMLSSDRSLSGFTSVCNIVKACVFRRFLKNFFLLFSPLFSIIVATFSTTLHVKQF